MRKSIIWLLLVTLVPLASAMTLDLSQETQTELAYFNVTSANLRVYNDGVCTLRYALITQQRQLPPQLIFLPEACASYTRLQFIVVAKKALEESITTDIHGRYEIAQRRRYRQQRDNGDGGTLTW